MHIQAKGIRIHCQIAGPAEAQWLIFGNSHATELSMWALQVAHFAKRFRVLTYDQRGHGQTDAPAGRYTFEVLIDDLLSLMDALGIEHAHYCGLSMGGATGVGLAQRQPARIDRLVVCDSPCASSAASAAQWEERCATARVKGMKALVDSTIARWFPLETLMADPPFLANLRRMVATTPVNGYIGCAAALSNHDFRTEIRRLRMPVLFVAGEKDGAVPAAMREMHAELSGSTFVQLSGAGHISNVDRPVAFNRTLDAFLATSRHLPSNA